MGKHGKRKIVALILLSGAFEQISQVIDQVKAL